jgi:hypothetical protein
VPVPGDWNQLALLSTDDTFTAATSQLYMYLANSERHLWQDKGSLWAFQVTRDDGVPVDPYDPFNGANDYLDLTAGEVFQGRFIRVEHEVTTPHPYTRTGERGMKFGIPCDEALGVSRRALALNGVTLRGVAMHIGSQVTALKSYEDGMRRLLEIVSVLPQSPALQAGLRRGDVIEAVDGSRCRTWLSTRR